VRQGSLADGDADHRLELGSESLGGKGRRIRNIRPFSVLWTQGSRLRRTLEEPMFFQTVPPLFAAGEVLLGLSLTMFVGALITTVSGSARSRQR
jgi:hypothetical protein